MKIRLVSILVAARNEEENILELLVSLEKLSYPKEKLQILIGNDASTDKTEEILHNFIAGKKHFQVINISQNLPNLKGKANVLAQLAHFARGEYFLFTDADIEVPTTWVEEMIDGFEPSKSFIAENSIQTQQTKRIGIVVGITLVKNRNWFEACQAIEWLFALKMMNFLSYSKIPTTGMGNNMAVLVEAYWAVGGYEKIDFSIVEDFALYDAILKKGFGFVHLFDERVMTQTKSPNNYFEQRKRWVAGGLNSKSNLIIPAIIQGLALPMLLIISWFDWKISIFIFFLNLLINLIIGNSIFNQLNQKSLLKYIPIYTIYMYIFWFLQFVAYFFSKKIVWKGRKF